MQISEMFDYFLKYEDEHELFERKEIAGIRYWRYLRYPIWQVIMQINGWWINITGNAGRNTERRKAKLRESIERYIFRNPMLSMHKEVLIFNGARRVKCGNYYQCIYTDEWLKDLKRSYCVCERPFRGQHFKPVKTKHLKYIDRTKNVSQKQKIDVRSEFAALLTELENGLGVVFDNRSRKTLLGSLDHIINYRAGTLAYYERLLCRINPKIIFLVNGYDLENMLMMEVAKRKGIPTVELEHGAMDGHLAYNFLRKRELPGFPDYIFTFGKYDAEVPHFPIDNAKVIPVGSAQLEREALFYQKAFRNRTKRKKIITFWSTGSEELINCALRLAERLDLSVYKIVVKLHPSEYQNWNKIYPKLGHGNVEIADGSKHNVYYWLAVSDWVIGTSSTTLIEATAFDTNILILKVGRYYQMKGVVEKGFGKYVADDKEVYDFIMSGKTTRDKDVDAEMFFARNVKERIYATIEQIIENS